MDGRPTVGRRTQTLAVVAMLLALPVFSTTQPGQAFNDVVGLAALLTAVASWRQRCRAPAPGRGGRRSGLPSARSTPLLVPTLALIIGVAVISREHRARRAVSLRLWPSLLAAVVSAVRRFIPAIRLGSARRSVRSRSGPAIAAGGRLAADGHLSALDTALWSSRFAPGSAHSLGVLWPVILIAWLAAVLVTLLARRTDSCARAGAAALAAITYLLLPTGATVIAEISQLFAVNLRYAIRLWRSDPPLPIAAQFGPPRLSSSVIPARAAGGRRRGADRAEPVAYETGRHCVSGCGVHRSGGCCLDVQVTKIVVT